jgi:hypothetical protein
MQTCCKKCHNKTAVLLRLYFLTVLQYVLLVLSTVAVPNISVLTDVFAWFIVPLIAVAIMGGTGSGRKRKQPDTLLNSGSIAYFWAPDRTSASVNVEAKNATADEQPPSEAGEDTSRVAELVAEQQAAVVLFSDAVGDDEEIAPKQKRRKLADVLAQGEMRYFEHAENLVRERESL